MAKRTESLRLIRLALALAQRCRHGAPTIEQLRHDFGMSRAAAFRWRRAWFEAARME